MAANLVSERPIDARTWSREEKGDPGSFEFEGYSYKKLRVIQIEVDRFWRKWSQLARPN